MRSWALAAALFCAATPCAHAQTNDDAEARLHFEAGRSYYNAARYLEAAREFQEAYRISRRLPLLLNIARSLEEANENEQAIAALDEWLAATPADDANREEVSARRERLVRELAAMRVTNALAGEGDADADAADADGDASAPMTTTRKVGLILLGTGAAAGAAAVGTGLAAHGIYTDLEAACGRFPCRPEYQGDVDRGSRLATTSTALTFVGSAVGIAGLVMVLVGGADEPAEAAPAPTALLLPRIDRTQVGAQLLVTF